MQTVNGYFQMQHILILNFLMSLSQQMKLLAMLSSLGLLVSVFAGECKYSRNNGKVLYIRYTIKTLEQYL